LLKCPGLFNNGVWTYGEYLFKGEALYEVFILLACLNLLYIDQYDQQFRFQIATIKPENNLKLMAIDGYNLSQKDR
jgi:hypothetical protein